MDDPSSDGNKDVQSATTLQPLDCAHKVFDNMLQPHLVGVEICRPCLGSEGENDKGLDEFSGIEEEPEGMPEEVSSRLGRVLSEVFDESTEPNLATVTSAHQVFGVVPGIVPSPNSKTGGVGQALVKDGKRENRLGPNLATGSEAEDLVGNRSWADIVGSSSKLKAKEIIEEALRVRGDLQSLIKDKSIDKKSSDLFQSEKLNLESEIRDYSICPVHLLREKMAIIEARIHKLKGLSPVKVIVDSVEDETVTKVDLLVAKLGKSVAGGIANLGSPESVGGDNFSEIDGSVETKAETEVALLPQIQASVEECAEGTKVEVSNVGNFWEKCDIVGHAPKVFENLLKSSTETRGIDAASGDAPK
ncbi:hypothetical protein U1Q18_040317, partial [Sarracenia purpurea var. burkii]